jgi:hypothetical protein
VQDFDSIRPYNNSEVPAAVHRLVHDAELVDGMATFLFPKLYALSDGFTRWITRQLLRWRSRQLNTVSDVQDMMRRYIDVMVRSSVSQLSSSGLEHLPSGLPRLFVSNHRDIVLDTVFLNRVLYGANEPTCRMAVGDNLLHSQSAADIMRLNKSFVVERNASGTKAIYRALMRTSGFIKESLAEGVSVWIAQRAGRAKDGYDRTDPALLKMLALAYRKEVGSLGEWLEQVCLIPVSIAYELDPCDLLKAQELLLTEQQGSYEKPLGADLNDMVTSVRGAKGHVHIGFGARILGDFDSADDLARRLDEDIVGGLKTYATHEYAAAALASDAAELPSQIVSQIAKSSDGAAELAVFQERLDGCAPELRKLVLRQYANLLLNKATLADSAAASLVNQPT